jgi:DNA-binding PucR family transcriptional regulator
LTAAHTAVLDEGVAGQRALPVLDAATRAICDRVADLLEAETDDLAETMTAAVFDEIPEYGAIANSSARATVLEHSVEHVRAIVLAIRTWSLPTAVDLSFVNARAALRAGQRIPLSALLHSYRLGHRTVWERMVRVLARLDNDLNAALALTTLTLNYTELISAAVAEGYVERQRGMLVQLDRDRRDLLETLLRGAVDRAADELQRASQFALVPGGDFLVVVMTRLSETATPTGEILSTVAEVLRHHLSMGVAQPFVVVRHGEVVSIAPVARARPAAIARLVRLAHAELTQRGEPCAVGISTLCAGLGEVARGYQEARYAVESVAPEAGVRVLLDQRVSDYLVERADGTAMRMIPPAARRFLESPAPGDRILVETLLAYAAAELSLRQTADRLAVHPNTVTYRLHKLGKLLERDLSTFSDLVEVVTWAQVIDRAS